MGTSDGFDFIPDELFDSAPKEPGARFLAIFQEAKEEYDSLAGGRSGDAVSNLALAYMDQLSIVAQELGFGSLVVPSPPVLPSDWEAFNRSVQAIRTRIRLRATQVSLQDSVLLSGSIKVRIQHEIDRLRSLIVESHLDTKKKKKLQSLLDQLEEELNRQRLSLAKLATVAAAVASIIGGSTTTLANGPKAMESIGRILEWIGDEKQAEEDEILRIGGPPKALPAPTRSKPSRAKKDSK